MGETKPWVDEIVQLDTKYGVRSQMSFVKRVHASLLGMSYLYIYIRALVISGLRCINQLQSQIIVLVEAAL